MHPLKRHPFPLLLSLDAHTRQIRSETANAWAYLVLMSFDDDITQLPRYWKSATSLMSFCRIFSGPWHYSDFPEYFYSVSPLFMYRPTESVYASVENSNIYALSIFSDRREVSTVMSKSMMLSAGCRLELLREEIQHSLELGFKF